MKLMVGRIVAVAALAVALAPLASSAHEDHCGAFFVLSGVDAAGAARAGSNPGAATCTAHDSDAPVATNYTVPGATHAWAAAAGKPDDGATASINGGAPIALTFFFETVRGRYESQSLDLSGVLPGSPIKITLAFGGEAQSLTYTRI